MAYQDKNSSPPPHSFFARTRLLALAIFLALFALGAGLRLLNLTNPPLDFHAWRQLRAASIARGMYYDLLPTADLQVRAKAHQLGNSFEILEPRIFERIVAQIYLFLGGERLWVARLLAICYWMVGAIGIFLLARRLTSTDGAIVSMAFYLLLPYGVTASRSFQPDPFMVMWIILAVYSLYRWSEEHTWLWTVLAGIFSGLAVLIKVFAAYPVVVVAIILVLASWGLKRALLDPQVWACAAIMALIPALYYIFTVGGLAQGYISSWVTGFAGLLRQPRFYVLWLDMVGRIMDYSVFALGFASIFLFQGKGRALAAGLWIGYLLMGMSVPSLIITHDYYNLSLIPIVAISLAPLGQLFFSRLAQQARLWQFLAISALLIGVGYPTWIARNSIVAFNYRPEILGWEKMGKELPRDGAIIGITHDYGARLNYYGWIFVTPWPYTIDQEMHALVGGNTNMKDPAWKEIFLEKTKGYKYFLVDNYGELDTQPVLKEVLSHYPSRQGSGYTLYYLTQTK